MRQRRTLIFRHEDYIGEPLGLLLLEPLEQVRPAIIALLQTALGPKVRIHALTASAGEIHLEVETPGWPEESRRLAEEGHKIAASGANRAAAALFSDSLELDPLNPGAHRFVGLQLAAEGRNAEALRMFRRVREIEGDSADLLVAMARCSLGLERIARAIRYLDLTLAIDPQHFTARRMLATLGRKPPSRQKPQVPSQPS